MTDEVGCVMCVATQESFLHVLRESRFASKAWMKLISSGCVHTFFELRMDE